MFWVILNLFGQFQAILGVGLCSKIVLVSSNIVEQLSFSLLPSILSFEFDLILWLFLSFWGPKGLFLGLV